VISEKIFTPGCNRKTRASGVVPEGLIDSLKAAALPAPDASTHTFFAAAIAV
jgi:hypothetical protein